MSMTRFLFKRLLQAVGVLLAISLIAFLLRDALPGADADGSGAAWRRYPQFLAQLLRLDFGTSSFFHRPALEVVLGYLPATLELVFAGGLLTALFAVPLGIYSAIKPHAAGARLILRLAALGVSLPVFLTAILLIQVFSLGLSSAASGDSTGWLASLGGMPAYGRGNPVALWGGWATNFASWQGLAYLALPALSLAAGMLPLFVRLIHTEMRRVLASDYIRFARARGLSPWRIYARHALKNALLPVVTLGGIQLGSLMAYTLLVESVFQWPGVGLMFLDAVERGDRPLIVTYLLVAGVLFLLINTVVDLCCRLLDPRVVAPGGMQ